MVLGDQPQKLNKTQIQFYHWIIYTVQYDSGSYTGVRDQGLTHTELHPLIPLEGWVS